jgi:hypothetical protein
LSDRDANQNEVQFFQEIGNDALKGFLQEAQRSLPETPRPAVAAAHLAAIAAAARTVDAPAGPARRPLASFRLRVLVTAGGLALLAAFGGAAYAGALPRHVQGKVAGIAHTVGISLPGTNNDVDQGNAGNRNDGAAGNQDQTTTTTTTPTGTTSRGADGPGDQAGAQQDNGGVEGVEGTQAGGGGDAQHSTGSQATTGGRDASGPSGGADDEGSGDGRARGSGDGDDGDGGDGGAQGSSSGADENG